MPPAAPAETDLFETYEHLSGHKPWDYPRDEALVKAMVARADPGWTPRLLRRLAEPMPQPEAPDFMQAWEDQVFWQATAAQVLERIESAEALEPLLNVMLDDRKSVFHAQALVALLPLSGTYARALQLLREAGHERTAARILAALGRGDAAPELVAATKSARDPQLRFELAMALIGLDVPAATVEPFKAAFDRIPVHFQTMGSPARAHLGQTAIAFRKSELVPWLLDRATRAPDAPTRASFSLSALMLARPSQLPSLERALKGSMDRETANAIPSIRELSGYCQEDFECYLQAVSTPANRASEGHAAIKAAYMLGVLGSETEAPRIFAALASLQSERDSLGLRLILASNLSYLLPHGSPAIVQGLSRLAARADTPPTEAAELRKVTYRLRAREGIPAALANQGARR